MTKGEGLAGDVSETPIAEQDALFNANYYQTGLGLPYERNTHWLNFFGLMADEIIRSLRPRKVFDAGCAMGFLVEAFWDRGVESQGIDISSFAISQVRRDMQPYCRQGSITEPIQGQYDLITCIEVLEHLTPEQTGAAIASLAAASDTILFSSSPSDFTEATHFNVRPAIGWLKLFAEAGFWPDCIYDAGFVAPHAMLLHKQTCPPDDVLALFSDKTRLKCALVEREQRIGLLDAKIATLTESVGDYAQLAEERARISAELLELGERYSSVLNELVELRAEHNTMSRESEAALRRAEAEAETARKEAALNEVALEAAKRDLTASVAFLASARYKIAREMIEREVTPLKRLVSKALKEILQTVTRRRPEELRTRRELLRRIDLVAHSQLFDPFWYLQNYPEVGSASQDPFMHFLRFGALERRNPGPNFDSQWYLDRYQDVAAAGVNPLEHYLTFGAKEGRETRPVIPAGEGHQTLDSSPRQETESGRIDLVRNSRLFDPFWYLQNYPEVGSASQDPFMHFLRCGAVERRNPGPNFDSQWYLDRYQDVAAAGVNPLEHYLTFGAKEGREIRPVTPAGEGHQSLDPQSYNTWLARNEPGPEVLDLQRTVGRNLRFQPLVSIVCPVYNVPLEILREMVNSVLNQTYHNWELCVVHGYPPDAAGREYLRLVGETEPRVKVRLLEENLGISGNSNAALELVQGEFIALLDHDDTLAPFALFEIANAINEHPDADLLYSDKDCVDEAGICRQRPLFKPEWSSDILLSANYLTHLTVIRTKLVHAVGGWRSETDGAQDWDIFLRITDLGAKVVFVPGVLYHWRIITTSVASGGLSAKPYATEAQIKTLTAHAERRGLNARANIDKRGVCKMEWDGPGKRSVSVVLVSPLSSERSSEDWARRLDTLTEWPDVEFVVPGANSSSGRVRSTPRLPSDSVATYLNSAIQASGGDYLVLLDYSIEVTTSDWLKELVGPMEQTEVAVVGAKLIDSNNHTLRHAGLVFNVDGTLDYIFSQEPEHICEQFGSANWYRDWSAVAGSCFAVRREAFDRAGGFSETPDYPRHDVDLCLRIRAKFGDRILYNPFARFFQSKTSIIEAWLSPDGPQSGSAYIRDCFPSGEPYFHKSLQSRSGKVLFATKTISVTSGDYAAESRALVRSFDATSEVINASKAAMSGPRNNSLRRLTWVLPTFSHAFYGGIHTIFRFADYFSRLHGVESDFVFLGRVPDEIMRSRIAGAFPSLAANCGIKQLRTYGDWEEVNESDATICTLWTTAYAALHFKNTRRKFYFVQDYESLFYPAGSTYALVEATYRFGYSGICNTRSLAETYREFGGEAEYFDPCIDSKYFYKSGQPVDGSRPFTIFCYARPGHPRNCFELLSSAFQKVKQRMGNSVRIFSAGAEWLPSDFGSEGVIETLGLLGYSATGALYRSCDMGVVMMMTRHPSYLPMELMACGALVVTNENRYTRWLLEDERNCLLSETSPGALADVIEKGLRDHALRNRITQRAAGHVLSQYSDWDAQTEKIYQHMVGQS